MKYTITLEYQGKQYDFPDEGFQDDEHVIWMYTEGNYGCDCNKSLFLFQYCDVDFMADEHHLNEDGELQCGNTIKLVSIRDGERVVWPGTALAKCMAVEQEEAQRKIKEILQYNQEHPLKCIRFEDYLKPRETAPYSEMSLADLDRLIDSVKNALWRGEP